jgi:hypothetical protein
LFLERRPSGNLSADSLRGDRLFYFIHHVGAIGEAAFFQAMTSRAMISGRLDVGPAFKMTRSETLLFQRVAE